MSIHQTSLSCGCNVDYSGQRCRFHAQAGNPTIGIVAAPKPYLCACPSDDPRPCPLHDPQPDDNARTDSAT